MTQGQRRRPEEVVEISLIEDLSSGHQRSCVMPPTGHRHERKIGTGGLGGRPAYIRCRRPCRRRGCSWGGGRGGCGRGRGAWWCGGWRAGRRFGHHAGPRRRPPVTTADGCSPRRRLPDPGVAQTEVELPGGAAVVRRLPPALDRVVVGGERALVALREVQRGEVRLVPPQRPHPCSS